MYKVLVVGCGGSGTKTVAFMMDQLKADLKRHGVNEIPPCWQFLAVDTPVQEEELASYGVARVTEQGGQYVDCGVSGGGGYKVTDDALTRDLMNGGKYALRSVASWMPSEPRDVTFSVEDGAGQHRAIGRLLVLRRLRGIHDAIEDAISRMADASKQEITREVIANVPGVGSAPDHKASPLVLVVSSMAGGSGSSMTLEVCRLLGANPGIDPTRITAFLYTADIFGEVGGDKSSGMPGNTLAMLGEILAAQSTADGEAARLDRELYGYLGMTIPAQQAFKRIVPIGARVGGEGGARIGEKSDDVFRAIGRGLSRYISSDALDAYVSYDEGNPLAPALDSSLCGWGVETNAIAWSSFGYASLSLGRERYLEYSSQRIARRVVNHALDAHRLEGDKRGDQMRLQELWDQNRARELSQLDLPEFSQLTITEAGSYDRAVVDWAVEALGGAAQNRKFAHDLVERVLSRSGHLTDGMTPSQWQQVMSGHLMRESSSIHNEIELEGLRRTGDWADAMSNRLIEVANDESGRYGLRYAEYVMDELSRKGGVLEQLVGKLQEISKVAAPNPSEFPSSLAGTISAMAKKAGLAGEGFIQLRKQLAAVLEEAVYGLLLTRACAPLSLVVADFSNNAVTPLRIELGNGTRGLEFARLQNARVTGLAQVETNFYQQWPREPQPGQSAVDAVPRRFSVAVNEVVLMNTDEYINRFDTHLVSSVRAARENVPGENPSDRNSAYDWVVRSVLAGEGNLSLIEKVSMWSPGGLQRIRPTASPRPARYRLRVQLDEVLGRARDFVGRTGEAFDDFAAEPLYHYASDPDLSDFERSTRAREITEGLRKTVAMARPLSSIKPGVYEFLHGAVPEDHFEFSKIPFDRITDITSQLEEIVKSVGNPDSQTLTGMNKLLCQEDVTRVDVFGSHARTVPVAYSGILGSVLESWDKQKGAESSAQKGFWKWHRARPLSACLPFGDHERKALIRGWFTALAMGAIQIPKKDLGNLEPVRIWDRVNSTWVTFPAPMLTSPSQMRISTEWLPAVLESSLLSYIRASQEGLGALYPYAVLRSYGHAGTHGWTRTLDTGNQAAQLLGEYLAKGKLADDVPERADMRECNGFDERKLALLNWLERIRAVLDHRYLPGQGKKDTPEWFTNYSRRDSVTLTPLTIDLAQQECDEVSDLIDVVTRLEEPAIDDPENFDDVEF